LASDLSIRIDSQQVNADKTAIREEIENLFQQLPKKIRSEFPQHVSLIIRDLNPDLDTWTKPDCSSKETRSAIRYGRYNRLTRNLLIDFRVFRALLELPDQKIDCAHPSSYRWARAVILHELVHVWDYQTAVTDDQTRQRQQCHLQLHSLHKKYRHNETCRKILAKRYQLSGHPQLLRLGYWQKELLLPKQANTRPRRLADPYAYRNPREFLAIEMEYFLLDPNYICRQPDLYTFFSRTLKHLPFPERRLSCQLPVLAQYGELSVIKQLNPQRIYRIDYLMAGTGDTLASHFGHSMLRLVICAPARYSPLLKTHVPETPFGEQCLLDTAFHLVIGFRANVEDVILNHWKGISGAYESRIYVLPYTQVRDEYTRDQLRDIFITPLKLSRQQQKALLAEITSQFWQYGSDYKFFTRNCATELRDLISRIFPEQMPRHLLSLSPMQVLEQLRQAGLLDAHHTETEKIPSEEILIAQFFHNAFQYSQWENMPVRHYLNHTRAKERRAMFSSIKHNSLEKQASLRRLEQQIKRNTLKRLNVMARYYLYQNNRDDNVSDPMNSASFIKLSGYGIPFEKEMSYDETEQMQYLETLKTEMREWLKTYRPREWSEYMEIEQNLNSLTLPIPRAQFP
jgi:hypothetical protein